MKEHHENKASGTWDKVKGKTNEAVGDIRDDPSQEMKGKAQQARGEAKQEIGEAQKNLRRDRDL